MIGATKRQSECLKFIRAHFARHGRSPKLEEIKLGLGYSSRAGIHRLVTGLIARGHITRASKRMRGIKLVEPIGHDARDCSCPGCSRVRVRAHQTFIETLHVSAPILSGSNFKSLGLFDRTCWRIGFPKPAHPETGKTKPYVQPAKVME